MAKRLVLPPLSETQVAELRHLHETAPHAKRRLRAQMILLAHQGRAVADIAAIVFRSSDNVEGLVNRFVRRGIVAVPPHKAPGMAPTVTPTWTAELLRVIDLDPHTVSVSSANWTTGLLATYLADKTQIAVTAETVRLALHTAGYVCKRPTWTLKRKAETQPGYVGNACGWR